MHYDSWKSFRCNFCGIEKKKTPFTVQYLLIKTFNIHYLKYQPCSTSLLHHQYIMLIFFGVWGQLPCGALKKLMYQPYAMQPTTFTLIMTLKIKGSLSFPLINKNWPKNNKWHPRATTHGNNYNHSNYGNEWSCSLYAWISKYTPTVKFTECHFNTYPLWFILWIR